MKANEGFILSTKGLRLFHRHWPALKPKAICLIVHGLAEHSGRYDGLAQILVERHLSVWAVDHIGHGRSDGRRGDCCGLETFVEGLKTLADCARMQAPNLPQIVIGHSLGGLVALTYAVQFPNRLKAVAVSSPALKLAVEPGFLKRAFVTAMAYLIPTFPIPNGVRPNDLSHDPTVVEAYQNDPLIFRTLTARCALALDRAINRVWKLANRLVVPCLILQAGKDRICDPSAAERFAHLIQNAPVTFRRYDRAYHELFNETDRNRVIFDLCTWIERILEDGSP